MHRLSADSHGNSKKAMGHATWIMVNINVNINICYIRWTTYYGLYKLYILRLMYGEYSPIMVDIFRRDDAPTR